MTPTVLLLRLLLLVLRRRRPSMTPLPPIAFLPSARPDARIAQQVGRATLQPAQVLLQRGLGLSRELGVVADGGGSGCRTAPRVLRVSGQGAGGGTARRAARARKARVHQRWQPARRHRAEKLQRRAQVVEHYGFCNVGPGDVVEGEEQEGGRCAIYASVWGSSSMV
jgi:hypothetical protein